MTIHRVEQAWAQQKQQLKQDIFTEYAKTRSIRVRNRIVEQNMGLVQREARHWANQCSTPFEDLVNEGVFGLIKAIQNFDPRSGNAFSSFAVPYISGAIQHYLRDKGWGTVRPPRRAVETYAKVKKAQRVLAQQGRELPAETVAQGLGITRRKWRFVQEAREQKPVISLDEKPLELPTEEPQSEDLSWVYEHLEALGEPARSCVIESIFGQLTDEAIAERKGLSALAVRLMITQSLEQIRANIVATGRMG